LEAASTEEPIGLTQLGLSHHRAYTPINLNESNGSMKPIEQQFFNDLEKKLWTAADQLRSNLDAAVYKHVVLGLIFLKYVSDAFEERQRELRKQFTTPGHDYYMDPEDFGGEGTAEYETKLAAELEVRDYYTEKNVFWVPREARWQTLRDCAQLPPKAPLPWHKPGKDEPEEMRSAGWLIDNAMDAVERENPRLKNVLNKDFARIQLDPSRLAGLIGHFSDTDFSAREYKGQPLDLKSKDILGHVYEYFLGEFALAEGKKGGQYYTPKSIVTLIVAMLQPFKGRVYDPAMGSGGFFVQSEEFIAQHGGKVANGKTGQISIYGQESNPTTWRLAAMNMAIRGIDFNFGDGPADTLLNDQHPDLRADYVMANPPFNMKQWWSEKLTGDPRWLAGTPPQGNANFAWLQHMLHHLAPTGSMGLLLANGSMSSNTNNEGEIRKKLIEDDYVECMVALPGQLFTNTQIPACIWFLTRDKKNGFALDKKKRDRRGQFLFIDARQLGYMKDRVLRDFTGEDIQKIADTFHAWQQGGDNVNEPAFCYAATLDEIRSNEHMLTPGRYVGAVDQEEDGEAFSEKMTRLTAQLTEQFAETTRLKTKIRKNLAGLGYDMPLEVRDVD
jgi:type I restriction enzyme M protein